MLNWFFIILFVIMYDAVCSECRYRCCKLGHAGTIFPKILLKVICFCFNSCRIMLIPWKLNWINRKVLLRTLSLILGYVNSCLSCIIFLVSIASAPCIPHKSELTFLSYNWNGMSWERCEPIIQKKKNSAYFWILIGFQRYNKKWFVFLGC